MKTRTKKEIKRIYLEQESMNWITDIIIQDAIIAAEHSTQFSATTKDVVDMAIEIEKLYMNGIERVDILTKLFQ